MNVSVPEWVSYLYFLFRKDLFMFRDVPSNVMEPSLFYQARSRGYIECAGNIQEGRNVINVWRVSDLWLTRYGNRYGCTHKKTKADKEVPASD